MKSTLVILGEWLVREALADEFARGGAKVSFVPDAEAAAALVAHERCDVMILAWDAAAAGTISRIRSTEGGRGASVVAIVPDCSDATLDATFDAGVDDFVCPPLSPTELVTRARRVRRSVTVPSAARSSRPFSSGSRDISAMDAFDKMGELVAVDLAGLVGPGEVAEGFHVSGDLHSASIPLSVATDNAEIRISVVVEKRLLRTLAGILLCDENSSAEAIADMMREVANTAGGSVKRAAERSGFRLTTGIPVDIPSRGSRSEVTRCWTISIHGSAARIGIIGDIQRRATRRVSLAEAAEGMVIALPVVDDVGRVIIAAGERLSVSSIADLTARFGSQQRLSVIDC